MNLNYSNDAVTTIIWFHLNINDNITNIEQKTNHSGFTKKLSHFHNISGNLLM